MCESHKKKPCPDGQHVPINIGMCRQIWICKVCDCDLEPVSKGVFKVVEKKQILPTEEEKANLDDFWLDFEDFSDEDDKKSII